MFVPDYEYTPGVVEETNGILMYSSSVAVSPSIGLKAFDNLCEDSKPAKCADGYFPISMACAKDKRNLSQLPDLLSAKVTDIVYGPNGKAIGSLGNIAQAGVSLSNSAKNAGVKVTGDLFWSGCTKAGLYDTNSDLACTNWSTKTPNLEAACGKLCFSFSSKDALQFIIDLLTRYSHR